MTDQTRASLVERLRKLKAMAEGAQAVGNQAEAEAFAAKVQELLFKHKLDMSELELQEQEAVDPLTYDRFDPTVRPIDSDRPKRRRLLWLEQLAAAVARAQYCDLLLSTNDQGFRTYIFLGRQSDVALTTWLFTVLARAGFALSRREYARAKKEGLPTTDFHKAFQLGYSSAIVDRYRAQARKLEQEQRALGKGTALVRLDTLRQQVAAFTQQTFHITKSRGPSSSAFNDGAFQKGREHGNAANLSGTGLQAGGKGAPAVGPGIKRLGSGGAA